MKPEEGQISNVFCQCGDPRPLYVKKTIEEWTVQDEDGKKRKRVRTEWKLICPACGKKY